MSIFAIFEVRISFEGFVYSHIAVWYNGVTYCGVSFPTFDHKTTKKFENKDKKCAAQIKNTQL